MIDINITIIDEELNAKGEEEERGALDDGDDRLEGGVTVEREREGG